MKRPLHGLRALPALAVALGLAGCPEKRPDTPPPAAQPAPAPVTAAVKDYSHLPTPGPTPHWAPPAVSTWQLANGLTVWHLEQGQVPLANATLVIPRGAATDPANKAGTTSLMADMLDEGAGGQDALALGEAFQRLGTDYGASVSTDSINIGIDFLADQAEPSLALLQTVLFKPDFPAAEMDRRKAQRMATLLAAEADPASSRGVVLRRMLFGEGYGGFPADGIRSTVEHVRLDDVKAQYKAIFTPDGASVIVVGALSRAATETLIQKTFGAWQGTSTAHAAALEPKAADRGIYLVDHPGATQSAIAVAERSSGAAASDLFESQYYNWSLGGAFTSRVNLNLREDKGYTYGARSMFNRWRDAGFFSVGALVKAQNTRESIDEIQKELAQAGKERPLTDKEVGEARGGLLLSFPGRFENQGAVAGQLAELPVFGRPADWYTQWPGRVEAVTAAQVNAVAQHVAPADGYIVVVSGDRKMVEPALAPLKLPIHICDAQGNVLTP